MDSTSNHTEINQIYRLLALCARAESHPLMAEQLAHQLEAFTAWHELPAQAELHGMAPLLWHHIRQSGISIPPDVQQSLGGLYLRHRAFNQAHMQVLLEVSAIFESTGISTLALKGLALAYQYYPDIALRPVTDIDFLLKRDHVLPALDLLANADFRVDSPPRSPSSLLPKELTADSPLRNGIRTHIELHHYDPRLRKLNDNSLDDEFMGFAESSQMLMIGEQAVYVPMPMDTLNYLVRHLKRHLFEATARKPLQLKWVADIISLVERHAETMDWDYLQQHDKTLLERLEVFYSLTPMPEHCTKLIPIRQISPSPGFNQYPHGWPQQRIQTWKQIGLLKFLRYTFVTPSNWWLRLYYGINEKSVFWYGQVIHRLRILKLLLWALVRGKP